MKRLSKMSNDRRRILFVDNRVGYVLSHRLPWLQGACDAGFDVHVTTLTADGGARVKAAGFPYHAISDHGRSNDPLREAALVGRLGRLYRALKPDLIHHITLRAILYGSAASLFVRKAAVVNSVTGLGYLFSSNEVKVRLARHAVLLAARALRRKGHAFIFQNPDDQQLFQARRIVSAASSFLVKGSGVRMDHFDRRPEPSGRLVIVFPARMLWHKGVHTFVRAARQLRAEGSTARFVMVGDTDPDNPASVPPDQLHQWEQEGGVEWWGHQESMPDVFAQSHVVCLPSVYREGVPRVLIEAASCGRAIVTTDRPGCREIVRDGQNGYLVPPRDAGAVAEALRRLIGDAELRLEMGRRGRKIVEAEFSTRHVVGALMQVYEDVLSTSGAGIPEEKTSVNVQVGL